MAIASKKNRGAKIKGNMLAKSKETIAAMATEDNAANNSKTVLHFGVNFFTSHPTNAPDKPPTTIHKNMAISLPKDTLHSTFMKLIINLITLFVQCHVDRCCTSQHTP